MDSRCGGCEDRKKGRVPSFRARAAFAIANSQFYGSPPFLKNEAATACGAGPPEGAETPLSALGPQFQDKRPHSTETLLCTEHSPCFLQDLLRAACNFFDYYPNKTLPQINDMFTFNDHGYIYFDQTKWATYMEAMKEDKPPPDCSRRTKKSDVSKGAPYLARKTLVLTEEFFRVRYNEAIQLAEGKLDMRTYNV